MPVVIDEAYVDFGGETRDAAARRASEPAGRAHDVEVARARRACASAMPLGDAGLIEALTRVKDSFNSYPLGRPAQAGAIASVEDEAYFQARRATVMREPRTF